MDTGDGLVRVVVLMVLSASAARGQETSRASVDSSGAEGNGSSMFPSISADGRYVAFDSFADDLVAGDSNGSLDVFVRDRWSGATERVSVDSSGAQADGGGSDPSISADGRYVAYRSWSGDLVADDANGFADVFVHDRQTGETTRVSRAASGGDPNESSFDPSISADGRHVVFVSWASNLVDGDTNGAYDVFVHDRKTSTTTRVSVDSSGAQASSGSIEPCLSADGRYVAFESEASDLVVGDTNGWTDVFVHDRQDWSTRRVSVNSAGTEGNHVSQGASISADGGCVAFHSFATNLVSGDTNQNADVFVHDLASGATSRVSVDSSGAQATLDCWAPSISGDGRHVGFWTYASLVPDDSNAEADVFVHDRTHATTRRVSVDSSGAQGNAQSLYPSISTDGRHIAFWSLADTLVPADTNAVEDVFTHGCVQLGARYCAAGANSTGSPASLSAACSASAQAEDLVLDAVSVPNQFGVFFHAANRAQVVFGNGFLCASGDIVRGAVTHAVGNLATYTYDGSDAQHSVAAYASTTRHFQYWFRDPMGGGALFDTSDAVSIAILP